VRPFAEYTIDIPVNRQGYTCAPSDVYAGDQCLGNNHSASVTPSRFTLGVRMNAFLKGLMLTGAVDIGVSGKSTFIEEVAPQAPYTIWWGLGYGFDTVERPPVVKVAPPVEKVVMMPAPPQYYVSGLVHEAGNAQGLSNAVVRFDGRDLTGMVTDGSGRFKTGNLEPGTYTFRVKADGYKEGTCSVTVSSAPPAGTPAPAPLPPPGQPGMMPMQPPPAPPPSAPPAGSGITNAEVDCALESLPKQGNIVGSVVNAEGGGGVGAATVTLVDQSNKERTVQTDGGGGFRFPDLTPGTYKLRVSSEAYLGGLGQAEVKPREDAKVTISVNKRPKNSLIQVGKREIVIKQQVHFETASAKIMSDSSVLLEELADVLNKNPKIKSVEIQGHTDNQGPAAVNKTLSEQRAESVRDRLVSLGVSSSRLQAKGYGAERPIVPNVTAGNRARNRRVALIILDQDKDAKK
jgi:outer membrane protein OmpA-like peptidoglycan-associated protein